MAETTSPDDMGHIVEVVETDVQLHKKLVDETKTFLETKPTQEMYQQGVVPDVDLSAQDDPECEVASEEPARKELKAGAVRTLKDILDLSGFEGFCPKKDDCEEHLFARIQELSPFMDSFCSSVRIAEGLLSKASVTGQLRARSQQQIIEHELAEARAEYVCSAARQSRHALWADFSHRVSAALKPLPEESVGADSHAPVVADAADGAAVVKTLMPCSSQSEDGQRLVQLLLVKPFLAGGAEGPMRIAMVVCVWRGGKSTKQYVWPDGKLPISASTRIHARILTPQNQKNSEGDQLCVGSCISPLIVLGAHDGTILCEVPASCYTSEFTSTHAKFWISRKTVKAIATLNKANVQLSEKKKEQDPICTKAFFHEDDFQRSAMGTKNAQIYVSKMRRDYEQLFPPLVGSDGTLKLRNDIVGVTWSELLARLPSYFKKFTKTHAHWKGLSAE